MPTSIAVPKRYDDVTLDWLRAALLADGIHARPESISRGPVFGYKKNKFRVAVTYADDAPGLPTSYVVKGNFPDEDDPATGSAWAMASELRSFRDVVTLIAAPATPRSHYIGIGDDASVVLMEDLRLKGAQSSSMPSIPWTWRRRWHS